MKRFLLVAFFALSILFLFKELSTTNIFSKRKIENVNLAISNSNELEEDVEKELSNIDFSKLDNIVENFDESQKNVINSNGFLDIVKNFIYSNNFSSFSDVLKYILHLIFSETISFLPQFILIFIISILYGLIDGASFVKNEGTKKIVSLVCVCSISVIIFKIVTDILKSSSGALNALSNALEILLPIILTLIASIGGTNIATIFQPTLAIFCNVVTKVFTNILLPIFIFSIVFNVVGNLHSNIKLEKFSKFLNSLFKSVLGIVFTIFIAFLSIKGLTASSIDGISIKTAKYALKNYIPILGSYLSDGVGLILLSTNIIKNAVGVAGLIVLIFIVLKPILQILLLSLLFKFFSAVLEVVSSNHSKLLYDVSKSMGMLNLCLIATSLMSIIFIAILLSVSNIL